MHSDPNYLLFNNLPRGREAEEKKEDEKQQRSNLPFSIATYAN